jgi:GNAT superfamily N-acetyltransferase
MTIQIRRVRSDEGLRVRALRLHALADTPLAYGSTLAGEQAFDDAVWHERARHGAAGVHRVTYVAEEGGRWVGLVTGVFDEPNGSRFTLHGMFVEPAARGRGVGTALVDAVTGWARERGATELYLGVTSMNHAAIRLYHRCGFRPTGQREPLRHTPAETVLEMVRDVPGRVAPRGV